ncbi:MAG: RC-LH1 core complex protein PufX [Pseudomonadota bacterium]
MAHNSKWYLEHEKQPSLYLWIFTQMTMGAAYAALVCMAVLFFILFFKALSALLPEDPNALLDMGTHIVRAIV